MINDDDKVDKVNSYMQDDLAYERKRNDKIKSKLKEEEMYQIELTKELRSVKLL